MTKRFERASPVKCIMDWLLASLAKKHLCCCCGKVGSNFCSLSVGDVTTPGSIICSDES